MKECDCKNCKKKPSYEECPLVNDCPKWDETISDKEREHLLWEKHQGKVGNMEYIHVFLPASQEDYRNGDGELVWVLVTEDVKKAYYNTDEECTSYTAILDDDSIYYPKLVRGTEMPIEMRVEDIPVVPYNWLVKNYREGEK